MALHACIAKLQKNIWIQYPRVTQKSTFPVKDRNMRVPMEELIGVTALTIAINV